MIKFKNVNINKLAQQKNTSYYNLDILRQTTIKKIIIQANKQKLTAEQTKIILLNNVKYLLDLMIKEEDEGGKNESKNNKNDGKNTTTIF